MQNITRPVVTAVAPARTDAVSVTGSPAAIDAEESAMVVLVAPCDARVGAGVAVHSAAIANVTETRTSSG